MFNTRSVSKVIALLAVIVCMGPMAYAQDETTAADAMFTVNNLWIMIGTFLVFVMHLGFATLESGLVQAKHTVNVLFKNTMVVSIGLLLYAMWGFNLMYPGDFAFGSWLGFAGFGIDAPAGAAGLIEYADGSYTYWADFLFQGMFAATCATIVSGAVAGRVKLKSFLLFTVVFVGLVYPILGSWHWGGGWVSAMGFHDFAGSTLVHSVGGIGALAGAMILGPRIGKYTGKQVHAIPASNMPLVTIGVFLLWLGWFGFNGASVLSADPGGVSFVLTTTSLAAAAGIVGAYLTSMMVQKKPDLSMTLNGCLAGLVGITAGADTVSVTSSILIGLIAGVLVVFAVIFIDTKLRIDDPVGAVSVHLVCGFWGTMAVGIFSTNPDHSLVTQFIGFASYAVVAFIASVVIFGALKATIGIRVPADEEIQGLDLGEHGMEAYAGIEVYATE